LVNSASFIRSLRTKLGCTQKEFSLIAGVSNAAVSRWENEQSKPVKRRWELFHDVYWKLKNESDLKPIKLKLLIASVIPSDKTALELYRDEELTPMIVGHLNEHELMDGKNRECLDSLA